MISTYKIIEWIPTNTDFCYIMKFRAVDIVKMFPGEA